MFLENIIDQESTFSLCLHEADTKCLDLFWYSELQLVRLMLDEFLIEDLVCSSQNTVTKESAY